MARPIDVKSAIEEMKRIEEDTLYSSKSHFVAAESWTYAHFGMGIAAAVLSLAATHSGFVKLLGTQSGPNMPAVLAAVVIALLTFIRPDKAASAHWATANRYLSVRSDAREFRTCTLTPLQERGEAADGDDGCRYRHLRNRKQSADELAPKVVAPVYWIAKLRIRRGESEYERGASND